MAELLPLFLNLTGRAVLLVGGGRVAAGKLAQLLAAGADVRIVAPEVCGEMAAMIANHDEIGLARRPFVASDLDDVWLVVAAATPEANGRVAQLAEPRRLFVNAVDDPPNATAYLSGVVRRDGVTIAISTSGDAPALTALLREGVDAMLPRELETWMATARRERGVWRRDRVPIEARKPRLLQALNALYAEAGKAAESSGTADVAVAAAERGPAVPWLSGPEDSWL
jgi:siroheme synthase-like protein